MKKLLFLFLFLFVPTICFSQGKLSGAKQSLSTKSSTSSSSSSSSSSSTSSSDGSFLGDLFVDVFIDLFLIVGYEGLFGNLEVRHFSPHPYYYSNVNGEYDYGNVDGDKRSLLKVNANYLTASSIQGIEASVNYRFIPILGVELSHSSLFENNLLDNRDNFNMTSIMFNYYRIRERSVTGYWGIGATYVGDEVNTKGFAYNIGLDVYAFKPISLHGSFKQSFINESSVDQLQFQVKYNRKRMNYYGGYNDYSLGGVDVSGFILGAEMRF